MADWLDAGAEIGPNEKDSESEKTELFGERQSPDRCSPRQVNM